MEVIGDIKQQMLNLFPGMLFILHVLIKGEFRAEFFFQKITL